MNMKPSMTFGWRAIAREAATVAGFLVWAVTVTWPLALHLPTRVPNDLGDPLENAWIIGWGGHAIVEQPRAIFDGNMFFPSKLSLVFAENLLGISVPLAPLTQLTGNAVLVTNVAILLLVTVSAYAVHRLALELTGDRAASLLAGLAFATAPYRLASITHLHVLAIHLLPVALLAAVRLARRPGWRPAVALAVVLGLQVWSSVTGAVITLAALGAAGLWVLATKRRSALVPAALLAGALVAGLAIGVPVVRTYQEAQRQNPTYEHPEIEAIQNSATPGAFLYPTRGGAVVRPLYDALADATEPAIAAHEKTLFPGIWMTIAALAGAVAVIARRRVRGRFGAAALFAAIVAATGFVFALGPRWGASEDGAPMPFALIAAFVEGLTRVPARFGVLVTLAAALLAAIAIAAAPARARRVVLAVSGVALALEAWPAGAMTTLRAPELTAAHRSLEGTDRRVLALPTLEYAPGEVLLFHSTVREARHLWYSTANYRPMTNGYGAFLPQPYVDIAKGVQEFPTGSAMALLHRLDVDTVVVETDLVQGTRWQGVSGRLAAWPGVRLLIRSGNTEVYDVAGASTTEVPAPSP